ncbi:Leucine-rich receptor-like protein kinase family protein [Rhynchospora pubera]|uniref:Leucine-rich receptor-like protein kinase family protein n=1 Tax=Rhynchospora pubera TaxID=906938 RepID=A0AAV8GL32_9POAL|nr:Leucine-rich receptor-like protein kinase family protein [Rhynchospora pubera]
MRRENMLTWFLFFLLSLLSSLPKYQSITDTDPERSILLSLKASLDIPTNETSFFSNWTSSNSKCNFPGVSCNSNNNVSSVNLENLSLSGTIPFGSLCQLPSLTVLSLGFNQLAGPVTAVQNCTGLLTLDLAFNNFHGAIPDLSPLKNLQILNISDNLFTGPFPWDSLGNLTELQVLSLGDNYFDKSGFPYKILNLTKLYLVYLSDTNIGGEIPKEIGDLTELQDLELSDNFITGQIPAEISRLKNLQQLELYNNSLTGTFPAGFGNLTNLAFFDASMNYLEGNLSELRTLENLVSLQLFFNNFSGEIPQEFGDFKYLVNLSLYSNRLTGQLPQNIGSWAEFNYIDVSTNFLSGPIPPDMCKKGTMMKLFLLENQFSGEIPASYANCTTLTRFRVNNNSLSGTIPDGIWALPNVNILELSINNFEGTIDTGIGKAKSLYQLYLAKNQFSGSIPIEISSASSLVSIDISDNNISGEIPENIGELSNLVSLDLHNNFLSGTVPSTIGMCSSLNTINLSHNNLSGQIPSSLGNLTRLNSLDMSNNELNGEIPESLSTLKLSYLSLINNQLTGPVPASLSSNAYSTSFAGNPGLCAYTNTLFLRECSSTTGGSSDKLRTLLTCLLAAAALILSLIGVYIIIKRRRAAGRCDSSGTISEGFFTKKDSWSLKSFRVLSFDEQEIIESIKEENLIGKGGSGNVYRVKLRTSMDVAVKHIVNEPVQNLSVNGTAAMLGAGGRSRRSSSLRCREFEAEVNTLSSIRHVNVVNLYCSITSDNSSLLVYEFLPNGSLYERLHTPEGQKLGILDWETRYDIAVGAARGLEYLHHGCDRPILHRDVKSSNILLDECFKPRIADFGLAKMLRPSGQVDTMLSQVIAGTYGYIAPEYAHTWWKVNEKSDVYSFGVVLMELVTGKKPIEMEYGENRDIVYWVSQQINCKEKIVGLIDAKIQENWELEEAVKVLGIAVLCTARVPSGRPSMRRVVQLLEEVASCRSFEAGVDIAGKKADVVSRS